MTYCVAIQSGDGLVFCSDSRTNAGPDLLSSYSKMHTFAFSGDRMVVILSAGNLATTQAVISRIEAELEDPGAEISLKSFRKMVEVAGYIASISREVQEQARLAVSDSSIDISASFIVGGQTQFSKPAIHLIYPAGNFISASAETPYLQIGESKYGKPILDRILGPTTSLEDAARCALVSMDSTIRANATVGPPIEILVYEAGTFESDHHIKLAEHDPYLNAIRHAWNEALQSAFSGLPLFAWEDLSCSSVGEVDDQDGPGTVTPLNRGH